MKCEKCNKDDYKLAYINHEGKVIGVCRECKLEILKQQKLYNPKQRDVNYPIR